MFNKALKFFSKSLFKTSIMSKNMRSPTNGILGSLAKYIMDKVNINSVNDAINKLNIKEKSNILEIGSGNGCGLETLSLYRPNRLISIEISEMFRKVIEKKQIKGLELYSMDCKDMSSIISSNSIDYIIAFNVVYFLHPLNEYAAELKRVLKKDTGKCVLGCKFDAIQNGNDEVFRNKSLDKIVEELSQAGLTVTVNDEDLGNRLENYTAILISHH